uniref:Uncharacterized protein n=1 Tax=Arundo donax TaxID=35708 RepID=A0A0A9BCF9_ARUDO
MFDKTPSVSLCSDSCCRLCMNLSAVVICKERSRKRKGSVKLSPFKEFVDVNFTVLCYLCS